MATFGKFVLGVCLTAVCMASRAFAIVLLWRWFVAAPFGVPGLSSQGAYGLALVFLVLSGQEAPDYKDMTYVKTLARRFAYGVVIPWIAVGIGCLLR